MKPEMRAAREEIFGPGALRYARRLAGRGHRSGERDPRGNGTSIFTENGAAVREYSRRVEVGMVGVNIGVAASPAYFPFSGWKDSFFGDLHVHGWDAVEFFTRKKTVTSRYFSSGTTGKLLHRAGRQTLAGRSTGAHELPGAGNDVGQIALGGPSRTC